MSDQREGIQHPFGYLHDVGDRLTGGGLRALARRALVVAFCRVIGQSTRKALNRTVLIPFSSFSARLYRIVAEGDALVAMRVAILTSKGLPVGTDYSLLVNSLYKTAFGGKADPRAVVSWVRELQSGTPFDVIAEQFVRSVRFQKRHGAGHEVDVRYLTALYRDGLQRKPDPEELACWLKKAKKGATRAKFLAAFAGSDEALEKARKTATLSVPLPDLFGCQTMRANGRVAVVLHLHYTDLWPEFEQAISSIAEPFDLFVTVTTKDISVEHRIHQRFPHAQVLHFENRGRDVLPFVVLINSGVLFRYQLVCKIHTKRSLWRDDGDQWRQILVKGILGGPDLVTRIIGAFDRDPDLGIVVADGQIYGSDRSHWAGNLDCLRSHAPKIGIKDIPARLPFPGGSMYWIRPFLLRQIRALQLSPEDFEPEPLPADGTTAHAVERLLGLICHDAGMRIVESDKLPNAQMVEVSGGQYPPLIAFYLPQFHPTPENDTWWGTGFTEWSNVTRAVPMFRHHRQPRLPADLGFYDLRLPDAREAQAELAKRYGLSAFCYYYYWFNGRRLLHRPLDEIAQSGSPDFPFLICWANESWTRNWDGRNREILIPQTYQEGWPKIFARDIASILKDRRYFRVHGKPVLLIYRITNIPDCAPSFSELRIALLEEGIEEVYIVGGWFDIHGDESLPPDPRELGIDNYYEFPPHGFYTTEITGVVPEKEPDFVGNIHSYDSVMEFALAGLNESSARSFHRGVMVGWDNTPRRMYQSNIVHGSTPAKFRRWLRQVIQHEAKRKDVKGRMVFINAWNEWAEGAYLEPDREYGHGWLEAVASAVGVNSAGKDHNKQPRIDPPLLSIGERKR
jgi:lipopolysaccharide biosynthesis protein